MVPFPSVAQPIRRSRVRPPGRSIMPRLKGKSRIEQLPLEISSAICRLALAHIRRESIKSMNGKGEWQHRSIILTSVDRRGPYVPHPLASVSKSLTTIAKICMLDIATCRIPRPEERKLILQRHRDPVVFIDLFSDEMQSQYRAKGDSRVWYCSKSIAFDDPIYAMIAFDRRTAITTILDQWFSVLAKFPARSNTILVIMKLMALKLCDA